MPARAINVTLGTAGHIDHGKTALVRSLTGCETDRLKEEKERGMSIDLGFAPCPLGDIWAGLVDVPGHENFIRTMVAGATGIDCAILVVAADDGVMPQTREHLDILSLLGIRSGVVALTKIDRVPQDRRTEAEAEVRALLRGTFLERAPLVPVSNVDGEGLMDLREALRRVVADARPRDCGGIFRAPIERTFAVRGHGTIATGIPVEGRIAVGQELELFSSAPSPSRGRVRAIQVYQNPSDEARAGQCCALNVPAWDATSIRRGDVAALPGWLVPARWLLLRLRLLRGAGPLRNAARVRLHTGTSEVSASLYPLEPRPVEPGCETLAQAFLSHPLVAGPGEAFIIRTTSPGQTIGGGTILSTPHRRLRRTRPETITLAHDLDTAVADRPSRLACALLHRPHPIARAQELAREALCLEPDALRHLAALKETGAAVALDAGGFIHRQRLDALASRLRDSLVAFHSQHPESPGPDRRELASRTAIDPRVLERLLPTLLKDAVLAVHQPSNRLCLPNHRPAFPEEDRPALERIELAYAKHLFQPPDPDELATALALQPSELSRLIQILLGHARLVRVAPGIIFHHDAVTRASEIAREHLAANGRLESVEFKYILGTTRKFALPLLDHLDHIGVTRRAGNTRLPMA